MASRLPARCSAQLSGEHPRLLLMTTRGPWHGTSLVGLGSGPWHEPITQPCGHWERGRGELHLSETGIALSFLASGRWQAPPRRADPRLHHPAWHPASCSPAHANTRRRAANPNIGGIARKSTWAALPCCCLVSVLPAVLGWGTCPAAAPARCLGRAGGSRRSWRGGRAGGPSPQQLDTFRGCQIPRVFWQRPKGPW